MNRSYLDTPGSPLVTLAVGLAVGTLFANLWPALRIIAEVTVAIYRWGAVL